MPHPHTASPPGPIAGPIAGLNASRIAGPIPIAGPSASPSATRAASAAVAALVALAALAALGCASANATLPRGSASEPIPAGVPYRSPDGFSLLPGSGWVRVPAGTVGDPSSTLELFDEVTGSFVVFYVHGSTATIDALVANRRTALGQAGEVWEFQEERRFSPRAALVPISTAHYRVQADGGGTRLLVVTAHGAERTVEAVGLVQRHVASELRMRALLESLVP